MDGRTGAVVVADRDGKSRALVTGSLRQAGYETVEVASGWEVLEAVRRDGVSLVVLEVELPDMTGYQVCRDLRNEKGDEVPIFFLSGTHTEPADRVAGLLLGADDFIVKPFDPGELVARVQRFVARRSAATRRAAGRPAGQPHLTDREAEVLQLLADGMKPKEVATTLSISPKTVATHIQNLLGKLSVHSRAELVARAYQLRLVGEG